MRDTQRPRIPKRIREKHRGRGKAETNREYNTKNGEGKKVQSHSSVQQRKRSVRVHQLMAGDTHRGRRGSHSRKGERGGAKRRGKEEGGRKGNRKKGKSKKGEKRGKKSKNNNQVGEAVSNEQEGREREK